MSIYTYCIRWRYFRFIYFFLSLSSIGAAIADLTLLIAYHISWHLHGREEDVKRRKNAYTWFLHASLERRVTCSASDLIFNRTESRRARKMQEPHATEVLLYKRTKQSVRSRQNLHQPQSLWLVHDQKHIFYFYYNLLLLQFLFFFVYISYYCFVIVYIIIIYFLLWLFLRI
jgi:hypothetical protein